jgi:hypothetical protein
VAISYGTTRKREQVGAGVELLAAGLIGRRVSNRAHRAARTGEESLGSGSRLRGLPMYFRKFGQSEVENLGLPAFSNEDIGGLS